MKYVNKPQNYNRYAYVLNNPFKYTDQSGEFWEVLFGTLFSAYVHGASANGGELNPAKWNAIGWKNAGANIASFGASNIVTNLTNNYVDNYNKPPELGVSAKVESNRGEKNHPYVSTSFSDIHSPTQHTFLGINMTALSEGNFLQQAIYGAANSFNIPVQYMMGRSVGDGSMRNLNGTATSTDEGVMAFGTLPLWFTGGGQANAVAGKGGSKYLYHYTSREAADNILKTGLTVTEKRPFIYTTNIGSLSPLQAQIELALPTNRVLPNTILRIDASRLNPFMIRRVQGNLPGLGAGGGTEFMFNQNIPANLIKIIK